jgi:hypothetical protein
LVFYDFINAEEKQEIILIKRLFGVVHPTGLEPVTF